MKYQGIRDKHLNVYIPYNGDDIVRLENNITKAFINMIQSLSFLEKTKVFDKLFNINLKNEYYFEYYLQRSPKNETIKLVDPNNRMLFAFSPTGEHWGFNGSDTKNEETIRKEYIKFLKEKNEFDDKEIENITNDYLKDIKLIRNGGSIPDAWIIIYDKNRKPLFAIAMENKRYDLDPYQLNNHLEKSLFLKGPNKNNHIIYSNYKAIVEYTSFNTYMTNSFKEYLIILGYLSVDDFMEACNADKDIRQRLAIVCGKDILKKVCNEPIDKRNYNTWRCKVNYEYLHEINLCFDIDSVYLSLAYGPTQNSAKKMLTSIDNINLKIKSKYLRETFHLQYNRGKNIKESYIDDWELDDYIDYWKGNIDLLHLQSPQDGIRLFKKLYDDKKIDLSHYKSLESFLSTKKNKIQVVPEIIYELGWTYEEISIMGEDEFVICLKETINDSLKMFNVL